MNARLLALYEEKGALAAEIKRQADAMNAARDASGNYPAEMQAPWDRVNADYKSVENRIAVQKRMAEVEASLKAHPYRATSGYQPGNYAAKAVLSAISMYDRKSIDGPTMTDDEYRAITKRVRSMSPADRDNPKLGAVAMSGTTAGAGGDLVPTHLYEHIALREAIQNPLMLYATVHNTERGGTFRVTYADDLSSATGGLIAENTSRSSVALSVSPTMSAMDLTTYPFNAGPTAVSSELMQDASPEFVDALINMFGPRIGRVVGPYLTTGTGTSQPNGIVTAAPVGKTAASSTTFTADEIYDLIFSIDKAYRPESKFLVNDVVLKFIRTLKDSGGRYIFQAGQGGAVDTLNGSEVVTCPDMNSAFTTGKIMLLYGRLSDYHIRRMAYRLIRLGELGADLDQTYLDMILRVDGNLMLINSVKTLKLA